MPPQTAYGTVEFGVADYWTLSYKNMNEFIQNENAAQNRWTTLSSKSDFLNI